MKVLLVSELMSVAGTKLADPVPKFVIRNEQPKISHSQILDYINFSPANFRPGLPRTMVWAKPNFRPRQKFVFHADIDSFENGTWVRDWSTYLSELKFDKFPDPNTDWDLNWSWTVDWDLLRPMAHSPRNSKHPFKIWNFWPSFWSDPTLADFNVCWLWNGAFICASVHRIKRAKFGWFFKWQI